TLVDKESGRRASGFPAGGGRARAERSAYNEENDSSRDGDGFRVVRAARPSTSWKQRTHSAPLSRDEAEVTSLAQDPLKSARVTHQKNRRAPNGPPWVRLPPSPFVPLSWGPQMSRVATFELSPV